MVFRASPKPHVKHTPQAIAARSLALGIRRGSGVPLCCPVSGNPVRQMNMAESWWSRHGLFSLVFTAVLPVCFEAIERGGYQCCCSWTNSTCVVQCLFPDTFSLHPLICTCPLYDCCLTCMLVSAEQRVMVVQREKTEKSSLIYPWSCLILRGVCSLLSSHCLVCQSYKFSSLRKRKWDFYGVLLETAILVKNQCALQQYVTFLFQ